MDATARASATSYALASVDAPFESARLASRSSLRNSSTSRPFAPRASSNSLSNARARPSSVHRISRSRSSTRSASLAADVDARGVPLGQLSSLLDWWEESLWTAGFLRADGPPGYEMSRADAAMARLRRLVLRAAPSEGDASLLRGALRALAEPKK